MRFRWWCRVDNNRIWRSREDDSHVVANARVWYSTAAVRAVIAIVVLAASLLAGCMTHEGAAQTPSTPAAPVAPAPTTDATIGLPRARDYEPIPELRDIYFDFGRADIRPADIKILDANAAWLRAHPSQLVLIEGYSDSRGATDRKNEFNMDLGERRAQAARSHLIAQGIDPSRIPILSYGQERPKCTDQTERCWSQNRRSRFLVKPR